MNLNQNPTKEQLKAIIASCDDQAGHHMPWVDNDGNVHITLLPDDASPNIYGKMQKDAMRFRMETYCQGNNYVGPDAANDDVHVGALFDQMLALWNAGATGSTTDEWD